MTSPDLWHTWTADDPEPAGVSVVRDSSGVVSYADSPEWKRTTVSTHYGTAVVWQGYKQGARVELDWSGMLAGWGPVTGKNATTPEKAAAA